ncbi:MAG: hypothetical protein R3B90_12415 [Planctomycetaceae bacterium]
MSRNWDNGAVVDAGRGHLGERHGGVSGAAKSTPPTASSAPDFRDQVGNGGVVALTNGNHVVRSNFLGQRGGDRCGGGHLGAGNGGDHGAVDATNSLVGTQTSDQVGNGGVVALTNGNYVVRSTAWDNGTATNAGAVTWGSGTAGVSGAVDATNSLVGTQTSDQVGNFGVVALTNGNYVVVSRNWDNGAVVDVRGRSPGERHGGGQRSGRRHQQPRRHPE